jgi:hypothetical protein
MGMVGKAITLSIRALNVAYDEVMALGYASDVGRLLVPHLGTLAPRILTEKSRICYVRRFNAQ